ncbi:hypothetical protein ABPG75_012555 [Micractinium tetrahymenae]
MGDDAAPVPLHLPAGSALNLEFCKQLAGALEAASRGLPTQLRAVLPAPACQQLLRRAEKLLKAEPTLLHVHPPAEAEVAVVGDLHGQFHDLLTILNTVGYPSASKHFVFDGDFVDRGAWGLEIVLLLAALKVAAPASVALVRGNHESLYCSWVYGFRAEVLAKYGEAENEGEAVFSACRTLFSHLPLAAVVAGSTLVLHGGLPRAPPKRVTRRSSVSAEAAAAVGSLADIAAASKGGEDPEPERQDQRLAVDVLWSDPASQPGVQLGARPGDVGILFGPDVTEAFLRDNGLRLILRGHEGPDARALRPDMQGMQDGFTLDHDTPCGKLYTVFSAPQYPQFGALQHDNLGAVAVLAPPRWDEPRFVQFGAAPRPEASPYQQSSESLELDLEDMAAAGELPTVQDTASQPTGASGSSSSSESSSSEEEAEEEAVGARQEAAQRGTAQQGMQADKGSAPSLEADGSSLSAGGGPGGTSSQLPAATAAAAGMTGAAAAGEPAGGEPDAKRQRLLAEALPV